MIEFFGDKINVKAMKWLQFDLFVLIAGAVGNLIDRIFRGFVVDMIELTFINYPVFNFADCCVVIGSFLFCIYILKYDSKAENKNGDT